VKVPRRKEVKKQEKRQKEGKQTFQKSSLIKKMAGNAKRERFLKTYAPTKRKGQREVTRVKCRKDATERKMETKEGEGVDVERSTQLQALTQKISEKPGRGGGSDRRCLEANRLRGEIL